MQAFTSLLLFMFSAVDLIFVFTLSLHYLRQVRTIPSSTLAIPNAVPTFVHNG
jgi:hypothetical protein